MRTRRAPFLLQPMYFFPALHIQPPCELNRHSDSGFYPFLKVALCAPARVDAALLFNPSEVGETAAAENGLFVINASVPLIRMFRLLLEKTDSLSLFPRYRKQCGIGKCVRPAEVFKKRSYLLFGFAFPAEYLCQLWSCNLQLQFPLL